ncbi:MAG: ribosomal subunit interface protein [Candidatus Lambdaproteobacteria bacterium RIFOXYD2_FULL_56_26]|uniref:Ribosome hibernation promoting factor n=1 Tax=Candidatus Lambdaproteobacteria bacterium RIFOXYD2_FULL_56_26 TaxID=1817773 RepID=A0A1F6H0D0_9PROT|nr:MAG: ribosomal subunit interface protein [Candidatus Lambdaproteobacteria bacterium RIFOXYD2_FULL_56_26]
MQSRPFFTSGGEQMDISISAKHMELTEALKAHVNERMIRVKKYSDHRLTAEVHLGVEKHRNMIHCTVTGSGTTYNSEAEDPQNMYKAIDLCVEKLEKQMARSKKSQKAGESLKDGALG